MDVKDDFNETIGYHRIHDLPADLNSQFTILAGLPGAGDAPQGYTVLATQPFGTRTLVFQNGPFDPKANVGPNGWTMEVLLALCQHRLESFQGGALACSENAVALTHIEAALRSLHRRTQRRALSGLEGKMVEKECCGNPGGCAEKQGKAGPRVTIHEGELQVTVKGVSHSFKVIEELQSSWSTWQKLESVLRRCDPPVTAEEMSIIERIVTTGPARNGMSELRSALGRSQA